MHAVPGVVSEYVFVLRERDQRGRGGIRGGWISVRGGRGYRRRGGVKGGWIGVRELK